MKRKKILIIASLIITPLLLVSLYLFRYQQLVNEGSSLLDEHCLKVNPLVIERKNAYLRSMRALLVEKSGERYKKENERYLAISKKYLEVEEKWLDKQTSFLNRWDTRLLLDPLTKEAGYWEYKMYLADFEGTEAVVGLFYYKEKPDSIDKSEGKLTKEELEYLAYIYSDEYKGEPDDLQAQIKRSSEDLEEAEYQYNKLWDERPLPSKWDIRQYVITIPPSTCPEENYYIPDVDRELERMMTPKTEDEITTS